MSEKQLLQAITDYYLDSRDFNGLPIRTVELPREQLEDLLIALIKAGDISVRFDDGPDNPYVKRLKPLTKEKQIECLRQAEDITHIVAYPEGEKLRKAVVPQRYNGRPYRLIVAKGMPILECAYFKLESLEKFRNDPRYYYQINDIVGAIYNHDGEGPNKADSLYIKSVGFAYDDDMNRAVCIFYADLMDLRKEQQQYWKHYEINGNYRPHPDYIWSQVYGQWPEKGSLPEAFSAELGAINELTMDSYGKKLFKENYSGHDRPKELSFLIRPTAKEFDAFIHILDKLISENIDRRFFRDLVNPETEEVRKDGKILVRQKGSLRMLEEHVRECFKPKGNSDDLDKMFATFKKIRSMRTKPAHTIQPDKFDMKYFKEQRALLIETYGALRLLRLILQNHPDADRSKIPDWLYKGDIWTY